MSSSRAMHKDSGELDYVLQQRVERDILLLYHQLSEYSCVTGAGLYFGSVFALPYWEYLAVDDLRSEEQAFIRDGCLIMILAMAWERIDAPRAYMTDRILEDCRHAVQRLAVADDQTRKLVETVTMGLDMAERGDDVGYEELSERSRWVYKTYVRRYFADAARLKL